MFVQTVEDEIDANGPWVAGIDFPFGQPSRLIHALGWPQPWSAYVSHVDNMGKNKFECVVSVYSEKQPCREKQHRRATDVCAGSTSPMKLYFQSVGKMFFEGAPRILRSGASIIPCVSNDSDRVIVEAYPALAVRAFAGKVRYKSDKKPEQTPDQKDARRRIVDSLTEERCKDKYNLTVRLDSGTRQALIDDPRGDLLDAVLCALQAAWSSVPQVSGFISTGKLQTTH